MKKRIAIVCFVLVAVLAAAGGYSVFNSIFPQAEHINCPIPENIISVTISDNNNEEVQISNELFGELVSGITNAEPTRKQSVNDCPTVNPHYEIEIKTEDRLYCYFIYEEGSVYIEMPYEGVWRSDAEFYGTVTQLFDMM